MYLCATTGERKTSTQLNPLAGRGVFAIVSPWIGRRNVELYSLEAGRVLIIGEDNFRFKNYRIAKKWKIPSSRKNSVQKILCVITVLQEIQQFKRYKVIKTFSSLYDDTNPLMDRNGWEMSRLEIFFCPLVWFRWIFFDAPVSYQNMFGTRFERFFFRFDSRDEWLIWKKEKCLKLISGWIFFIANKGKDWIWNMGLYFVFILFLLSWNKAININYFSWSITFNVS